MSLSTQFVSAEKFLFVDSVEFKNNEIMSEILTTIQNTDIRGIVDFKGNDLIHLDWYLSNIECLYLKVIADSIDFLDYSHDGIFDNEMIDSIDLSAGNHNLFVYTCHYVPKSSRYYFTSKNIEFYTDHWFDGWFMETSVKIKKSKEQTYRRFSTGIECFVWKFIINEGKINKSYFGMFKDYDFNSFLYDFEIKEKIIFDLPHNYWE